MSWVIIGSQFSFLYTCLGFYFGYTVDLMFSDNWSLYEFLFWLIISFVPMIERRHSCGGLICWILTNLLELGLCVCELLKFSFICLVLLGWTQVWNVGMQLGEMDLAKIPVFLENFSEIISWFLYMGKSVLIVPSCIISLETNVVFGYFLKMDKFDSTKKFSKYCLHLMEKGLH